MFYGFGLHRIAHGDNRCQARSPGAWGRHQSGRGGDDEPGTAAHRRAGAGGDVARGGGKRRLARIDDAGDERRLLHGGADAFQGEPRAGHLLRGGRHPRRAAVPEGGGLVRDRVHVARGHDGQDEGPDLPGASGTGGKDIHRLLPRACVAWQRDIRADAQRPGHRGRRRGLDGEGGRVLQAIRAGDAAPDELQDGGDVQADRELLARCADRLRQRAVPDMRQGGDQRVGADRVGEQASEGEHPPAGMRRGRALHSRGPVLHHGGLPERVSPDSGRPGDQQLQGFLVRRACSERDVAVRAGARAQADGGDDGAGVQAEHRRPAGVSGEVHRDEGDAGVQQRRHSGGGAQCGKAQRVQADGLPGGLRAGGHRGDACGARPVQGAAVDGQEGDIGFLRDIQEITTRSKE